MGFMTAVLVTMGYMTAVFLRPGLLGLGDCVLFGACLGSPIGISIGSAFKCISLWVSLLLICFVLSLLGFSPFVISERVGQLGMPVSL